MENKINTELDSMAIILHAGNAKSSAFEAMIAVKSGDSLTYEAKYQEAREEIILAKKAHAELLRKLSAAERMENIDLLLVHAEGHLSSTDIAIELIGDIGELYKWKESFNG
ncbi:PTS system, cellobiose-specific IIA component [Enterococcus sp. DIV2402]|uniref:PTS system, cellobiose-specific IIA component n=1 Tax=Candidatus Enterococcus lowellii TaxID=2230877 RepID=A0ABZ2SL78_9ENTE|nr:PTS lactose/cellobiose transporter subunit IIA [Enterococcus sp. DIV2402]MBO0464572.1 PTS lactose/cellobiose transporter subunit IIA [Enterococcus sp. DIV2402]